MAICLILAWCFDLDFNPVTKYTEGSSSPLHATYDTLLTRYFGDGDQ